MGFSSVSAVSASSQALASAKHRYQLNTTAAPTAQPGVRFGQLFKNGTQLLGAYIDPEPVSVGGLGKIGHELPVVFKDELGIPLLKISPLMKPMMKDLKDAKRLASFSVKDWKGEPSQVDAYELAQKDGVRRIVMANDAHFGQFDNLTSDTNVYQSKKTAAKALGPDAGIKAFLFFNKAVGEFLNNHQSTLGRKVDFIIANDWLTGPTLNELNTKVAKETRKIYFFHNHYDEPRRRTFLEKLGVKIPDGMKSLYQTSLSALGLASADKVIINKHYFDSLTKTDLAKDWAFLPFLKAQAGKTVDMHHGILETDNPRTVPGLKIEGFTPLKDPVTPEEVARFKAVNKKALQKALNLNQDPGAVVFSFVNRFDPLQKGFGLVTDTVKTFMKANPKAQMVLCGSEPTASIEAELQSLAKTPELRGRFYYTTERTSLNRRHQVMAGSDFFLMPSIYEPFGLSQLEAMKMAAIPIVMDVDGLKSTTSDPERNNGQKERAWDYGQIAIKAKSYNVPGYRRAFEKAENPPELSDVEEKLMKFTDKMKADKSGDGNGWAKELLDLREDIIFKKVFTPDDQKALDEARQTFRETLDRAMTLGSDAKKMNQARVSAIQYVDKEHTWSVIAKRYYEPLMKSLFPFLESKNTTPKAPPQ
jgi:glycogen synthase